MLASPEISIATSSSSSNTDTSSPTELSPTESSLHTSPPPLPLRKSTRVSHLPSKFQDFVLPSTIQHSASLSKVLTVHEPHSYSQAKDNPRWVEAMSKELAALEQNHTWELITLPIGKKSNWL